MYGKVHDSTLLSILQKRTLKAYYGSALRRLITSAHYASTRTGKYVPSQLIALHASQSSD